MQPFARHIAGAGLTQTAAQERPGVLTAQYLLRVAESLDE